MPRVEIIPEGWETSAERAQGDGTPTIDVCAVCHDRMVSGAAEVVGDLDHFVEGCREEDRIGEMQVEHPPYTDDDSYECDLCGKQLTEEDD